MPKYQVIVTVEAPTGPHAAAVTKVALERAGWRPDLYHVSSAVPAAAWPRMKAEPGLTGRPDIEGYDPSDPKAFEVRDDD